MKERKAFFQTVNSHFSFWNHG